MDVPDSADYFEEVREALLGRGVADADILAISAATGQGVTPLVRRLHALLDALPAQARSSALQRARVSAVHDVYGQYMESLPYFLSAAHPVLFAPWSHAECSDVALLNVRRRLCAPRRPRT